MNVSSGETSSHTEDVVIVNTKLAGGTLTGWGALKGSKRLPKDIR